MYLPTSHPWSPDETLNQYLERRGVSRRDFLVFCGQMTAALGLSSALTPKVVSALSVIKRPTVVWLSLQECTGCVESVLRTAEPTIGDLVLDVVSLDYQHNIMAAAGHQADRFTVVRVRWPGAGVVGVTVPGSGAGVRHRHVADEHDALNPTRQRSRDRLNAGFHKPGLCRAAVVPRDFRGADLPAVGDQVATVLPEMV